MRFECSHNFAGRKLVVKYLYMHAHTMKEVEVV